MKKFEINYSYEIKQVRNIDSIIIEANNKRDALSALSVFLYKNGIKIIDNNVAINIKEFELKPTF